MIIEKKRWLIVFLFATAMAWVESAVVVDLRTLVDRIEPYQSNPVPLLPKLRTVEIVREFATLIMLLVVGWLAGQTWPKRWGYALLAFGVWDIFYYVFLKIIVDWPHSLWDWDILFLLPLPWWGPVLAPMLIAALMIACGTLMTQFENIRPSRHAWLFNLSGCVLALLVFMADALRAADGGVEALRRVLPRKAGFNWPVFIIALVLMAVPIIEMLKQIRNGRKHPTNVPAIAGKMNFGIQTLLLLVLYKIISRET